jgi:cyanophycinase
MRGSRAALFLAFLLPTALFSQSTERPRMVIMGGAIARDNSAIYKEVLRGRQGDGPICVIPTASANAQSGMESAVRTIATHGGESAVKGVLLGTENAADADKPEIAAQLRGCGGFFFTGGVQSRVVQVFRPNGRNTAAYDALLERFRQGAVVSGSSAGAAIMSDPMIAGGSSAGALAAGVRRDDSTAVARDSTAEDGGAGVRITPGLGFLTTALTDQHFLARGRFARLVVATLKLEEYKVGFGIDENTALVVGEDHAWVVGASGVVVIDANTAQTDTTSQGGTNIIVSLLMNGDRYNLTDGLWSPPEGLEPATPTGPPPIAPDSLFNRRTFQQWLVRFAKSPARLALASAHGYRFTFEKDPSFRLFERPGIENIVSAGPWRITVAKER